MPSTGASAAVQLPADRPRPVVDIDRLETSVRALDPGSRALLDLSIRMRVRDEAMAPLLRVDPFHVAWLRARAIERIASQLGMADPAGIGIVRATLPSVPDRAWGRPSPEPPAAVREAELTTYVSPLYASPVVARYVAPLHPPVTDKLRSAAMGARAAARARPQSLRAAMRGALLTGAGAAIGFALSRRRR